ncbi:MAG: protein adenylyltransferase SelO family protein, partial [bacterium]
CNHSDYQGRYAFNQQPRIGLFNLSCLAQAMLPLFDDDPEVAAKHATDALQQYEELFEQAWLGWKRRKLGLTEEREQDGALYDELLQLMQQSSTDFPILFRQLSQRSAESCRDQFVDRERFDSWRSKYVARLEEEMIPVSGRQLAMRQVNPLYVLRNHMAETAIRLAEDEQDFSEINRLVDLLSSPFEEQPGMQHYAQRPPDWAQSLSVSCSS